MRRSIAIVPLIALLTFCTVSARTWHITPAGTGDAPTIQAGIDSASAGDTVSLACGTYYEHSIVMKSGVRLEGESGDPGCVVIDAEELGRVFYCDGVDSTTEFDGITITGGLAAYGGGMYCINDASPRLDNLVFLRNHSGYGGGLSCGSGFSVVLRNVVFEENSCGSWGGGICSDGEFGGVGSIELSNCLFVSNTAQGGAGMSCICECNARLDDVTFEHNVAYGGSGEEYGGGGLYVSEMSVGTITGCTFRGNSCGHNGGAMSCYSFCETGIENCLFSENSAGNYGGGIYCAEDGPTIKNCTFDRNHAGALGGGVCSRWWPSPAIDSCTFFMNEAPDGSGFGAFYRSYPWLVRSIVAYGVEGEGVWVESDCTINIRCSDIYGNAGGDWVGAIAGQYGVDGNFSACPSFCYADMGDFHLCDESPCLPGNHPDGYDCGLIGAWGEGCSCGPTQTVPATWGGIKSMYK
jgi:predicted outer membrane repeat protein